MTLDMDRKRLPVRNAAIEPMLNDLVTTGSLMLILAVLLVVAMMFMPTRARAQGINPQIAATQVVVIRSTAMHVAVGATLAPTARLHLNPGEQLVMVDGSGGVGRGNGPFDGLVSTLMPAPGANDPKLLQALAGLLAERAGLASLRGDVRSGTVGSLTTLPSPWAISVQNDGAACARGDRVSLWRNNPAAETQLVVEMGKNGRKARMKWTAGTDLLPVPASLFEDGTAYRMQMADAPPVTLTVRMMPAAIVSVVDQALWMTSMGCKVQALAMLDEIR